MGRPRKLCCILESREPRLLLSVSVDDRAGHFSTRHHARGLAAPTDASPSQSTAIVAAPAVVGRNVFYNESIFDGNNAASGPADDQAMATDKTALLPDRVAQISNFTSYAKGLNGLMVAIQNAAGSLVLSDFDFAVGNTTSGTQWAAAPASTSLLSRAVVPASGIVRTEFTWASGAIANQWLRVTVKADANTGLASPDVLYFGNLIGSAGRAPAHEPGLWSVVGT